MVVENKGTKMISKNPEKWESKFLVTAKTLKGAERRVKAIAKTPVRKNVSVKDSDWLRSYGTDRLKNRFYNVTIQYERK